MMYGADQDFVNSITGPTIYLLHHVFGQPCVHNQSGNNHFSYLEPISALVQGVRIQVPRRRVDLHQGQMREDADQTKGPPAATQHNEIQYEEEACSIMSDQSESYYEDMDELITPGKNESVKRRLELSEEKLEPKKKTRKEYKGLKRGRKKGAKVKETITTGEWYEAFYTPIMIRGWTNVPSFFTSATP